MLAMVHMWLERGSFADSAIAGTLVLGTVFVAVDNSVHFLHPGWFGCSDS